MFARFFLRNANTGEFSSTLSVQPVSASPVRATVAGANVELVLRPVDHAERGHERVRHAQALEPVWEVVLGDRQLKRARCIIGCLPELVPLVAEVGVQAEQLQQAVGLLEHVLLHVRRGIGAQVARLACRVAHVQDHVGDALEVELRNWFGSSRRHMPIAPAPSNGK